MHRSPLASILCLVPAALGMAACSSGTAPSGNPRLTARLAAGAFFTCALDHTGVAFCWGDGSQGQLGDGSTASSNVPVRVQGGPYVSIAAGTDAACGLRADGIIECWGGVPDKCCSQGTGSLFVPTPIATSTPMTQVSVAGPSACAIDQDDHGFCWGQGLEGALGNGAVFDTTLAPLVPLPGGHAFAALAQQAFGGCAIDTDGAAWCWGDDRYGQLGVGDNADTIRASVPVPVNGGLRFRQIAAGASYACGITTTGQTECWGDNTTGQLGDGTATNRSVPTPVAGSQFVAVFAGSPDNLTDHTCALAANGTASCWGLNDRGQLGGTGTDACPANTCSTTPVFVSAPTPFTTLALGDLHTCAMDEGGQVYCWGDNEGGQLGDGTTTGHTVPQLAAFTP